MSEMRTEEPKPTTRTRNNKRERLITAAKKLVHEQTFHSTTLAEIAKEGDVPLGNVYYYFKTKDAIINAVIAEHLQTLNGLFDELNVMTDPKARLNGFVQHFTNISEHTARFGCPFGSLCQELSKQENKEIQDSSTILMKTMIEWVTKQIESLGVADKAKELAENFVSSLQGASLLTLTFKDPKLTERQANNLNAWVAQIA